MSQASLERIREVLEAFYAAANVPGDSGYRVDDILKEHGSSYGQLLVARHLVVKLLEGQGK